jgi:oligopeptide transport system ATP-binding protein
VEPVLAVAGLRTLFRTEYGPVHAVNGVDFEIAAGETVGIVGESGSGKSQVLMSVMGLLPHSGTATGSVRYLGREILNRPRAELNRLRGSRISMVFQDPMTALNPYLTIGRQLTEILVVHARLTAGAARKAAIRALDQVRIPDPERRLGQYPHELSGGMRQRVMIGIAMLPKPDLLLADEPTTALDVTTQAEILELLAEQQRLTGIAIVLVTHDFGVVAGSCDRVLVMYGGRIVESGPVRDVFRNPRHPYTQGLLRSMPGLDDPDPAADLPTIAGQPPNLATLPSGCHFAPRCSDVTDTCRRDLPSLKPIGLMRATACLLQHPS